MIRMMRRITLAGMTMVALGPLSIPAYAQSGCTSNTCGVIERVQRIDQKGQGSGVGIVAGGVLGGVLGHQIGSGRGNTAATILGAGAGAYAGNEIEKNAKKTSYWSVAVRLDNGATRNLTFSNPPAAQEGERVRLVDGGRRLAHVGR